MMLLARSVVFCFLFTVIAGQCSNSQFTYSSVDNLCYFASRTSAPWATARNLCINMGARLAVIHDSNTNLAVDQAGVAVDPNLIFWIGLQVTGGMFQWVDGSLMDFTSWNTGFPQLVKGYDCVAERLVGRGFWENLSCGNSYPYICQANSTFIPTTTPGPFYCNNLPFYGPSGVITSPNYPNNYPDNANCLYNIILAANARVRLRFASFVTEACCDFLYIYDGSSASAPLISRFVAHLQFHVSPSGKSNIFSCSGAACASSDFISSSNTMTLLFISDASINALGFNASFTSDYIATLPPMTTTRPSSVNCTTYNATGRGEFYSYNYPSNYLNDLDCFYILNALSGQVPSIYFPQFRTETNYDTLSFYDGSDVTFNPNGQVSVNGSPYLTLSGTTPQGRTYNGRTQTTVLRFVSDYSDTFPGFDGQWTSVVASTGPSPTVG